jgi:hypothetical protein
VRRFSGDPSPQWRIKVLIDVSACDLQVRRFKCQLGHSRRAAGESCRIHTMDCRATRARANNHLTSSGAIGLVAPRPKHLPDQASLAIQDGHFHPKLLSAQRAKCCSSASNKMPTRFTTLCPAFQVSRGLSSATEMILTETVESGKNWDPRLKDVQCQSSIGLLTVQHHTLQFYSLITGTEASSGQTKTINSQSRSSMAHPTF